MDRFYTTSMNAEINHGKEEYSTATGIYAIFIMRESGCPFFYRIVKSRRLKTDPSILCGLFTALNMFVKQVTSGDNIERLDAGHWRFTFQPLQFALIVLCSSKDCNPLVLRHLIEDVKRLLMTDYKNKLQGTEPITVCDNSDFGEQIEKILSRYMTNKRVESLLPKVVG